MNYSNLWFLDTLQSVEYGIAHLIHLLTLMEIRPNLRYVLNIRYRPPQNNISSFSSLYQPQHGKCYIKLYDHALTMLIMQVCDS